MRCTRMFCLFLPEHVAASKNHSIYFTLLFLSAALSETEMKCFHLYRQKLQNGPKSSVHDMYTSFCYLFFTAVLLNLHVEK